MSVSVSLKNGGQAVPTQSIWIRGGLYDLCLVTGGAFFTFFVALTAFQKPALLPIFFWIWVVAFEGSHFWATLSRTYFDRKFSRENKPLLFGSLVFFAFPALALVGHQWLPALALPTVYGFFIFCWSLYHNARQHYGFVSIYSRKAGVTENHRRGLVIALYTSVGLAQLHFLFNFKLPGTFGLTSPGSVQGSLGMLLHQVPMVLSVAALVYLVYVALAVGKARRGAGFMPIYYVAVCWLFYSAMFYFVAPRDHFVQSLDGAETLMLIAIMNSLFHNIQYHAIVYHYSRRRYGQQEGRFGLARLLNQHALSYLASALLLGGVFGVIVWHLGDWPDVFGNWSGQGTAPWAFVLFFGIIGHHFYLDQKIWRPSKSKELRSYLQ